VKRIRYAHIVLLKSLSLYRDDLEHVVSIFSPNDALDEITISDGQNEYESLDELREKRGDRVDEISIRSTQPGTRLHLRKSPRLLQLESLEATDEADAAFYKAKEFLRGKRRPLNIFMAGVVPAMGLLLIIAGFIYINTHSATAAHIPSWLAISFWMVAFGMLLWWREFDEWSFYYVSLQKRHESPSFFQRKKDDLVLLLIGAVLGVLGTMLVEHLKK
jgi:hypothetical protein